MKKFLITFVSAILFAYVNPQFAKGQNNATSYLKKGVEYYNMLDSAKAVEMFQIAADMGLKEAQFNLGICYYDGFGVKLNYEKSVELFKKSANQGYVNAQYMLGYCYYHGKGVDSDEKKAVEWYTKAANKGYATAQNALGECYYEGEGVSEDYLKAVEWFTKAANQGNAKAFYNLGVCYNLGKGVPEDEYKAIEWFVKAAEQGQDGARSELEKFNKKYSWLLQQTKSLTQKADSLFAIGMYTDAFKLFKKAAYRGDDVAQLCLARCYMLGIGIAKKEIDAVKWIRNSAKQENAVAQFLLGYCYENDIALFDLYRVMVGDPRAYVWYVEAAKKNYGDAIFRVGCFFYEGLEHEEDDYDALNYGYSWDNLPPKKVVDIEQNYDKAAISFRMIAEQGHPGGQYGLGLCYFYGQGVEKDMNKAVSFFEKAANQGLALAQYNLAFCYYKGEGIEKNVQVAKMWLEKAAAQGDTASIKALSDNIFDKPNGLPAKALDCQGAIGAMMNPLQPSSQVKTTPQPVVNNTSSSTNAPSTSSSNNLERSNQRTLEELITYPLGLYFMPKDAEGIRNAAGFNKTIALLKKNGNWKYDDFEKTPVDEFKNALSLYAKDGYNLQFNGKSIESTMIWFDDEKPVQWDYDFHFENYVKAKEMIFYLRDALIQMGYTKSSFEIIEEDKFDISYFFRKGTKYINIFTMSPDNDGTYPLCIFVTPDTKENTTVTKVESSTNASQYSSATQPASEQRRTLKEEGNGFKWYITEDGKGHYGAESFSNKVLIPLERGYTLIWFDDTKVNGGCFMIFRDGKKGVCDRTGKEIIPPIYESVTFLEAFDATVGYYGVKQNGLYGACDMTGKMIISCEYEKLVYSDGFKYKDSDGKWISLGIKLDSAGRAYLSR